MTAPFADSPVTRMLFVRPFSLKKAGGPTPPLGLLYLAAAVRACFGERIDVRIADMGLQTVEQIADEIESWRPQVVGFSTMSCEVERMQAVARRCRDIDPKIVTLVGGPHPTAVGPSILADDTLDIAAFSEAELTIVELIDALEGRRELDSVDGIAYRRDGQTLQTRPRELIRNLNDLPLPAWDVIDYRAYAAFPNWNGPLKKDAYASIATSRGCPYGCYFCHNIFGKQVRLRSPENVFAELRYLHDVLGVREVHVLDDVFNINPKRAERICELIIESDMTLALAFPNGLRADIMTAELIQKLRKAGTYKVHYGFETPTPRLQQKIGKKLDVEKANRIFIETSKAGIITGAYFMMGFPTQTRAEMEESIDFAARSHLDVAYFFKATPFPGSGMFAETVGDAATLDPRRFSEFHFYSTTQAMGELSDAETNEMILRAQQRFFLSFKRLWRGFFKAPRKWRYLRNVLEAFGLLLQGYVLRSLLKADAKRRSGAQ